MPAYHFVAMNQLGKKIKGVIEAENEKNARQLLRDKLLTPLNVSAIQEKKMNSQVSLATLLKRDPKLSNKELALFTRQFSTLLSAGLPIEEALLAVSEQAEKSRFKGLVLSIRSKVLQGYSLAASLREHPNSFSSLYIATIAAGEKSGHLDKVLLRLADYTEQQSKIRQKLKTALIYPVMIILVAISIVGFLLAYVVPKMVAVYTHLNQNLPTLTIILIAISHFIRDAGIYVIAIFALALVTWVYALKRSPLLRAQTHTFLLKLPLLGHAIKTTNTARFSRTLSILSASGVSVLDAMTVSSELISIIPIRNAVHSAVKRVREGSAIHLALKNTFYFSPMSIHMIASGEASGQLEQMLSRVAEHQEEEITNLIDLTLTLFEPFVILLMGVVVLFIVLAVLLPIFQLNDVGMT